MTAFSKISSGKVSTHPNKKDGGRRRPVRITGFWGVENFTPTAPGEWSYTWEATNCPEFKVIEGEGQIIATLEGGEITMTLGGHAEAKDWMDARILELIELQADVADPIPQDFIPFLGEPMAETMIVEVKKLARRSPFEDGDFVLEVCNLRAGKAAPPAAEAKIKPGNDLAGKFEPDTISLRKYYE